MLDRFFGITAHGSSVRTAYAPAAVTAIGMPLTFSIAHGIGLGFITYAAAKVVSGRPGECGIAVYVIATLFALKFSAP